MTARPYTPETLGPDATPAGAVVATRSGVTAGETAPPSKSDCSP
jgi:hypothetical protein